MLTILDKHYNNVKALDALNQELFQLQMADKETMIRLGHLHFLRHLQVLAASFPDCFPPDLCGRVKERLLLWQTSQVIESDGSLPEGRATGKNLLRLPKGHLWG